jgi:hypothetical protein
VIELRYQRVQPGEVWLACRHLALNLRREQTVKEGLKAKHLKAGWDDRYPERLLTT